jgi:predicted HD superfamily hydrolase involved in NAD metabolism
MHEIFTDMARGLNLQGDLAEVVTTFLTLRGFPNTAWHSRQVAEMAEKLALRFGGDSIKARHAGWLHDVSVVFLNSQRVGIANALGIALLPEEEQNPILIHQQLSAVMAQELFCVEDTSILDAIGCHTTLKAGAALLDKVLFVADKISWDQVGNPPYIEQIRAAAEISLDKAALIYIRSVVERRENIPGTLHPWLLAALQELTLKES